MPPRPPLDVWLHGSRVAELTQPRSGKITLQYTEEALARWPPGRPLLSVSMPVAPERYSPGIVGPWLENLLPEGEARTTLERLHDVRRGDVMGLLREIGRDCAGALVIQPVGDPRPPDPVPMAVASLSEDEVGALLRDLGDRPLGSTGEVRVSLAGQQPKLLLTRRTDGGWAKPISPTPSTHIIKPDLSLFPGFVRNEAACVEAGRRLGLGEIHAEPRRIDDLDVIVVSRYDRRQAADGSIERLHQEDVCQALSLRPDEKYWRRDGPASLRDAARVLDAWSTDGRAALVRLLRVVTFHVAIGNADAHAKNFSFLLHEDGTVDLAPVYDAASTIQYPTVPGAGGPRLVSRDLAMPIGGVTSLDTVTVKDLVGEGRSWGLGPRDAVEAVSTILDATPDALAATATRAFKGTDGSAAERLVDSVRIRCRSLSSDQSAGADDPTRVQWDNVDANRSGQEHLDARRTR